VNVLGEGRANGAISILHALGIGKGCSVGIQLATEVKIVDERLEVDDDRHGLLDAIESCWKEENLPIPREFGWKINSTVPIGQGLKSSSALSCAAFRALNSCAWAGLSNSEIADLAAKSQMMSNCAITGSMDDNWASLESGWKLVDPNLGASDSVIIQGIMDQNLSVLLCLRGKRSVVVSTQSFSEQRQIFERSLASIISGSTLDSMSSNGMAVAVATDDQEALRISNLCIASGAIASGISGSGPAIAIVCFEDDSETLSQIISEMGLPVISTRFASGEELLEEV
jgi:shikimate kinase|tara:strand:+ start:2169 stop:3023 length:855 start_codon:yes stop_codon:yes gene_type:complete